MMKISQKLFSLLFIICLPTIVFATQLTIVTEHLAPFQIVDSTSITGLSTEIVKATLKESGYEYNIEAYPWSLSFNRAKQEENICIYSLARIPERNLLFQWVGHITTSTISLYTLKKNNLTFSNLNEAKKYRIAVIKDDVTHHFLLSKGFVENDNLYVMSNYDALLQLLDTPSRQIDLVVLNGDLLNRRIKNKEEALKYSNAYMLEELTLDFYFACSLKTDKSIVNKLINTMNKLELSGINSKIRDKWKTNMVNLI